MADIRHRIGANVPTQAAYELVATRDGIRRWWTRDTRGESSVGGKLEFWFGGAGPSAIAEVTELVPNERVAWRIVEGPEEWVDTTVTFDIREENGGTIVVFTHAGWPAPSEFLHHCSTSWAYFLLSLKQVLVTGQGTPAPDNDPVDSWS